ncbi:MAG: hypothetical protein LBQ13_02980 [Endomicrobium sp.]|jgi:hypothetical protein|nr:hypothetical protein [Endomicrobium sp.]
MKDKDKRINRVKKSIKTTFFDGKDDIDVKNMRTILVKIQTNGKYGGVNENTLKRLDILMEDADNKRREVLKELYELFKKDPLELIELGANVVNIEEGVKKGRIELEKVDENTISGGDLFVCKECKEPEKVYRAAIKDKDGNPVRDKGGNIRYDYFSCCENLEHTKKSIKLKFDENTNKKNNIKNVKSIPKISNFSSNAMYGKLFTEYAKGKPFKDYASANIYESILFGVAKEVCSFLDKYYKIKTDIVDTAETNKRYYNKIEKQTEQIEDQIEQTEKQIEEIEKQIEKTEKQMEELKQLEKHREKLEQLKKLKPITKIGLHDKHITKEDIDEYNLTISELNMIINEFNQQSSEELELFKRMKGFPSFPLVEREETTVSENEIYKKLDNIIDIHKEKAKEFWNNISQEQMETMIQHFDRSKVMNKVIKLLKYHYKIKIAKVFYGDVKNIKDKKERANYYEKLNRCLDERVRKEEFYNGIKQKEIELILHCSNREKNIIEITNRNDVECEEVKIPDKVLCLFYGDKSQNFEFILNKIDKKIKRIKDNLKDGNIQSKIALINNIFLNDISKKDNSVLEYLRQNFNEFIKAKNKVNTLDKYEKIKKELHEKSDKQNKQNKKDRKIAINELINEYSKEINECWSDTVEFIKNELIKHKINNKSNTDEPQNFSFTLNKINKKIRKIEKGLKEDDTQSKKALLEWYVAKSNLVFEYLRQNDFGEFTRARSEFNKFNSIGKGLIGKSKDIGKTFEITGFSKSKKSAILIQESNNRNKLNSKNKLDNNDNESKKYIYSLAFNVLKDTNKKLKGKNKSDIGEFKIVEGAGNFKGYVKESNESSDNKKKSTQKEKSTNNSIIEFDVEEYMENLGEEMDDGNENNSKDRDRDRDKAKNKNKEKNEVVTLKNLQINTKGAFILPLALGKRLGREYFYNDTYNFENRGITLNNARIIKKDGDYSVAITFTKLKGNDNKNFNNEYEHIIGVDRGEKIPVVITITDLDGKRIETIIPEACKSYYIEQKLIQQQKGEQQSKKAKYNKNLISKAKNLADSMVEKVAIELLYYSTKYKGLIVLEGLSRGFGRGGKRTKMSDKQYTKIEDYLKRKLKENGILAGDVINNTRSGLLGKVIAEHTSTTCSSCGFVYKKEDMKQCINDLNLRDKSDNNSSSSSEVWWTKLGGKDISLDVIYGGYDKKQKESNELEANQIIINLLKGKNPEELTEVEQKRLINILHKALSPRKTQESYICPICGHEENADEQASLNIARRWIFEKEGEVNAMKDGSYSKNKDTKYKSSPEREEGKKKDKSSDGDNNLKYDRKDDEKTSISYAKSWEKFYQRKSKEKWNENKSQANLQSKLQNSKITDTSGE